MHSLIFFDWYVLAKVATKGPLEIFVVLSSDNDDGDILPRLLLDLHLELALEEVEELVHGGRWQRLPSAWRVRTGLGLRRTNDGKMMERQKS